MEIWEDEERSKESDRQTYIVGTYTQAVAKSWVNGHALLALCGQEPPLRSINDGASILSGVRATSNIVKSVLATMAEMEEGMFDASIAELTDLACFNQLLNWPKLNLKQREKSRELFDSWLQAVKPVIIVSLGQYVYAWLCQPTRRQTPPMSLLDEVGIPRIVPIPNGNFEAVVIPHLHPGSLARNPTTSSQDKIFWYTWVATWVCMDTAIRLLSQHDSSHTSRQILCTELINQVQEILKEAAYFENLKEAKADFARRTRTNASESMTCKRLTLEARPIRAEEHVPPLSSVSADRKAVLDLYLSSTAFLPQSVTTTSLALTKEGSRKRSRDMFEESGPIDHSPRVGLTSMNWGPSNNTLDKWRQVHDFIRNDESFISAPTLRNELEPYRQFFSVAASVHRYHGGLIVGEYPVHVAYPPKWSQHVKIFKSEFWKCVTSFQNAVIQSYIKRLPKFLLERDWTASSTISSPLAATAPGESNVSTESRDQMPIFSSLFQSIPHLAHPPYRFKLALERCGQTKGPPASSIRHQQAEALFHEKVPNLCGWSLTKVDWTKFLERLDEGVWIAASMEATISVQVTQPHRNKFIETFGESGFGYELVNDHSQEVELQKASKEFMARQSVWLSTLARGKAGDSPYLDLSQADGHKVKVSQRGKLQLRYKLENGSTVTTEIKLGPYVAPLESDDIRTIHFTSLGIDLRTATGFTIMVPSNNSQCTLPLSVMRNHKNGSEFINLWKAVRSKIGPIGAVSDSLENPDENEGYPLELHVSPVGRMGAKPPTRKPEAIQHPEENDALWLLKKYIDLHMPQGGDFWTGSKHDFPKGTDNVAGFIDFLKVPENCKHPYSRWWFELLVLRRKAQHNWSNWLACLRNTTVKHVNTPKSTTKEGTYRKKCAVITLGSIQATQL